MKQKYFLLVVSLTCSLCLLCGCAPNPLERAEATSVPGLDMNLHAASASDSNVDSLQATLYFRYLDTPMLAAETRTLTVRRDESPELAIVRALLSGPSAGHSELRPILPEGVEVEGVSKKDNILYITFNEALLTRDRVPADWQQRPDWASEAPILRALIIQSAIASVTESFSYTGVQILVHKTSEVQTSLRLENEYFLNGTAGLSDPLSRDESLLLTPENTAAAILAAWELRDYGTLYHFIVNVENGEAKPSYQDVCLRLDSGASLSGFTVSGGSVSRDGGRAMITAQLSLLQEDVSPLTLTYPLPLVRENDVWKISYTELQTLMIP